MRTLIVEDAFISQEFLCALMEKRGECVVVGSGEEGVQAFRRSLEDGRPFELVFMDILLPGMDGLQALETIRAMELENGVAETKVIVITALDDDLAASRAYIHGHALSYITKPIHKPDLEAELEKFGFTGS